MNETLEAMARAIFKSWFVDFDPVRAKASREPPESTCRRLGLTLELLALFPDNFQDSELGEIPKGWSATTLGEHIVIHDSRRIPLSSREREARQGPFPYYGAAALMDHVDAYLFEGVHILMGEDGSVANADGTPVTQYVWGQFWVNNHAHVLTAKSPMSNEHLLLALNDLNIAPFVTGAVQAKLSQGNLRRIPIIVPALQLMAAFGERVASLFAAIRNHEEQTTTLIELRDSLLPKLLTGELSAEVGVGT
jgi:type I restriction enzyme S subunit